jgi:hypothetical protein
MQHVLKKPTQPKTIMHVCKQGLLSRGNPKRLRKKKRRETKTKKIRKQFHNKVVTLFAVSEKGLT